MGRQQFSSVPNQHAQDLKAKDGAGALHLQLRLIADPVQRKEAEAQTDGLTDAAGQIERTVDRTLGALAGDKLVVVDGFTHQTPLHLNGHHSKAGADTQNDTVNQRRNFHIQIYSF